VSMNSQQWPEANARANRAGSVPSVSVLRRQKVVTWLRERTKAPMVRSADFDRYDYMQPLLAITGRTRIRQVQLVVARVQLNLTAHEIGGRRRSMLR
jgi:hypothetical protein